MFCYRDRVRERPSSRSLARRLSQIPRWAKFLDHLAFPIPEIWLGSCLRTPGVDDDRSGSLPPRTGDWQPRLHRRHEIVTTGGMAGVLSVGMALTTCGYQVHEFVADVQDGVPYGSVTCTVALAPMRDGALRRAAARCRPSSRSSPAVGPDPRRRPQCGTRARPWRRAPRPASRRGSATLTRSAPRACPNRISSASSRSHDVQSTGRTSCSASTRARSSGPGAPGAAARAGRPAPRRRPRRRRACSSRSRPVGPRRIQPVTYAPGTGTPGVDHAAGDVRHRPGALVERQARDGLGRVPHRPHDQPHVQRLLLPGAAHAAVGGQRCARRPRRSPALPPGSAPGCAGNAGGCAAGCAGRAWPSRRASRGWLRSCRSVTSSGPRPPAGRRRAPPRRRRPGRRSGAARPG